MIGGRPAAREGTYHLNPASLPSPPETDDTKPPPSRQAVAKAHGLLRKHAHSFPQDFWAAESDARTRDKAGLLRADAAGIRKTLEAALDDLKKAGPGRGQEPAAVCLPSVLPGFSDSRTFRDAFPECQAYGFFPHRHMRIEEHAPLVHGADERIDVRDLALATRFFGDIAREVLG